MKSNLILNQSTKTRLEIYKKDKTFDEFLNEMMDIIDKVTPVDIIKCDKFYTNEEIKSIKDKMEENMGKPGYGIIIDDTIYSDNKRINVVEAFAKLYIADKMAKIQQLMEGINGTTFIKW